MPKPDVQITTPTDTDVVIEMTLNAPLEKVWQAYTDPKLFPQWQGPFNITSEMETMDVKPGGKWRYKSTDDKGQEFWFRGEFLEVAPKTRLAQTFEFEGFPGKISKQTATFEETGKNMTKVTARATFDSKADRDQMVNSGMEYGVRQGAEKLQKLLAGM